MNYFKRISILLFVILVFSTGLFGMGKTCNDEEFKVVWPEQRDSIYPRSAKPADTVYLFDAFDVDQKTKTLINTAQGIINRGQPKVYLVLKKPSKTAAEKEETGKKYDLMWFNWLRENDYVKNVVEINSVEEYLNKFNMKRAVIVDPDFQNSLNIAAMVASVNNACVAYPEHIEKYDLEVVEDLRGKFEVNWKAYKWAFENLWPQMNHNAVACLGPYPELSHLRDYLVGKKIFTFWMGGTKDSPNWKREKEHIGRLLGKMPVNIPVMGFPWFGEGYGIGERKGVRLISEYGKFLVPVDWKANLSFWTGLEAKTKEFKQKEPKKIKLKKDKVYVTFCVSDGDNLNTWFDYFINYWKSDLRGEYPVGWTMGPSLIDMQAPLLDYYYSTMSNRDSFGAAVVGIGYMYPKHYGDAYGSKREKIWNQFLEMTEEYMKKLDMKWLWSWKTGVNRGDNLKDMARKIDGLEVLLDDYAGGHDYETANYILNDVAVFHCINEKRNPRELVDEVIAEIGDRRPAFSNVFLHNWAVQFEDIKEIAESFPDDYVIVRPEELGDLYKQYRDCK